VHSLGADQRGLADPWYGFRGAQSGSSDLAAAHTGRAQRRGTGAAGQTALRSPADGDFRMLVYVIPLCIALLGLALLLNLLRLVKGPEMPDRVLALDTLYINRMALLMLLGIWLASDVFFEAALLIAVMGFISTVALGKYLLHGDIID